MNIDAGRLQEAYLQSSRLMLLTEGLRDHVKEIAPPHAYRLADWSGDRSQLVSLATHICVIGHRVVDLFDECFRTPASGAVPENPEHMTALTEAAGEFLGTVESISLLCGALLRQGDQRGESSLAFDRLARRSRLVRERVLQLQQGE